jgi:hypothetical protein
MTEIDEVPDNFLNIRENGNVQINICKTRTELDKTFLIDVLHSSLD